MLPFTTSPSVDAIINAEPKTPTPMTLSSVMFYTGKNPYTGREVFVARTQEEKRKQKSYFFDSRPRPSKPTQKRGVKGRR